ncbi:MAG TPA: UbiA family prenyltransferase [Thermomicrobiales bacterium]|nr:UbiA family prenyltransferase [Thermomicrobiales bacterium]
MSRNRLRVAIAYLRLPHAVPILVVLASTAAFAVLAANGLPPRGQFVNLLLAMLGAQIAIGTVNELVDADTDARVKPHKPIPSGLVSVRAAWLLVAGSLALMAAFGARLGSTSLVLCAVGTALGIAYSLWFKRSVLAWLPYLVALPLLPIWVFASLGVYDARLLMLYPLGVFAVIGVHVAQSLPDVAADRAAGIRNLTTALGERRALAVCLGAIALSALLASSEAAIWEDGATIVYVTSASIVGLVLLNVVLYLSHPRAGVMACFPCVAVATAGLGLAWVLAVGR